jgi:acyl carrier protein
LGNQIYEVVCNCLIKSCGLEIGEIEPDKLLVRDLDIDSIDMLEIIFEMESAFSISIKFSDLENYAREITQGPFEINSIITDEGIESLKKIMPEISPEQFFSGMSVQHIPAIMTVESLVRIAAHKLAEKHE